MKFNRIPVDAKIEDVIYYLNEIINDLNSLVERVDRLEQLKENKHS